MGFSLRKWYLDCVTDAGEPAILYQAQLRWGAFSVRAAGVLGGATTLRKHPEPSLEGGVLRWSVPSLGVDGTWRALAPGCSRELAPGVLWECVQPRAQVELRVAGRVFRGLGYAEVLTLTVPPWRLPIDELRWGRFCAKDGGAVWIEWRGPQPLRLALFDGAAGGQVLERLRLHGESVLRTGRIGETALSALPRVRRMLPRIARLSETKWFARGSLGGSEGWAIHEVVRWPS